MQQEYHSILKKIRKEKGFTQGEIASYLNISRQAISQWERGISYPDMDNLILLCKLYKVNISDLTPLEEHGPIQDNSKQKYESNSTIEFLSILIILALASQIPILGMIIPICVVCYAKRARKNLKVFCFICIIAFLIGGYNTFNLLSYHFFSDYGSIKIDKINDTVNKNLTNPL